MTCIVGVSIPGEGCIIGGDSAGVDGSNITIRQDKKVFNLTRSIAVGFTTSFRMGQIIQYHLDIKDEWIENPFEWTITEFIPNLREKFEKHGFRKKKEEVESGGKFLLAIRDKLFVVEEDFQVSHPLYNYTSVGSGSYIALGSLYSTLLELFSPSDRVTEALNAAQMHNTYVREPFHMVNTFWKE